MKLLITGDWHYRSQNPISRTDNIQDTLNAKIREVGQIAYDHDVEAIVCPGDVFDSPSPAYSTLTSLERVIKDIGREVWAVPGNHDEFAGSLESLDRTAYGHLAGTGLIKDLAAKPVYGPTVTATGTGFSAATDNDVSDYLIPRYAQGGNAVKIHVAHGMLLERAPGFELKHTLLSAVATHPDCPQVCIVGHDHLGFGVKRLSRAAGGEVVFINPGALVRLSAHPGEMERTPQVCLLEFYPGRAPECCVCGKPLPSSSATRLEHTGEHIAICPECDHSTVVRYVEFGPPELWSIGHPVIETTLIPLSCARPGHEVLSREHIEAAASREAKMGQFLDLLSREGEAKFLDVQAITEGIARSENIPKPVVDEALKRIAAAREALSRGRSAS